MRGRLLKALKSSRREKIPFAPQLCLQRNIEIHIVLYTFSLTILFLTITTTINCINITMIPNTHSLYAVLIDEIFRVKQNTAEKIGDPAFHDT